ncbi:hypothetical protein AJ80_00967 [Polytolypa hystricis UAMH7299]|uniref:PIPK domain-containing protein n=1 Tax=Polytolypa hystricis (strain UAMH7299) TaxID=1447883 RepID=A0A2B7Z351_POLH7|nr:hypothetical protein AJ80_00967 [Polytolypa hystricis UAMH7299]
MTRRQKSISKSIAQAIDTNHPNHEAARATCLACWKFYDIDLVAYGASILGQLRTDVWHIDDVEYKSSFRNGDGQPMLKSIGDLGYSGSTFFTTLDSKYLIKSLPRRFEYTFFQQDLFAPYYEYMSIHPSTLLVHITDYLVPSYMTLGGLMNLVPPHHIVMENILYGKDSSSQPDQWETFDLKPMGYFYPERDLVPDRLTREETLNKLADTFNDKIRIHKTQFEELKAILEADTHFLQSANVVDYSLFLIRFPTTSQPKHTLTHATPTWRKGVTSADNKWTYRAILLDFFWAKHKFRAKATTGAIHALNIFARKGPMPITTTPKDYRKSFLEMVSSIIETVD